MYSYMVLRFTIRSVNTTHHWNRRSGGYVGRRRLLGLGNGVRTLERVHCKSGALVTFLIGFNQSINGEDTTQMSQADVYGADGKIKIEIKIKHKLICYKLT